MQDTEQRAHDDRIGVLVAPGPAAVRAGHLLSQAGSDLLTDHDLLHLLEHVLGLGQLQAQGVDVEIATFQERHLLHDWRVAVIRFDDDLHTYPHMALPP
jgi:hypothetical protein